MFGGAQGDRCHVFLGILEVGAGLLNRTGIICEELGAGGVGERATDL